MELLVSSKLAHQKFLGIPWNCSCQRNWRTWSSMGFHGISWNCSCHRNWRTPSSKEFHGIPWNCSCHRNWRTPNSMEFHGIPWNCSCHRNWHTPSSVEFHGITYNCSFQRNDAPLFPWNSMELLVSSKLAHQKFLGFPWNCSCQRNWRTPSSMEYHGTAGVSSMEFHGTYFFVILWNHWCHQYTEFNNGIEVRGIWISKFWWKLYSIVPDELISVNK